MNSPKIQNSSHLKSSVIINPIQNWFQKYDFALKTVKNVIKNINCGL